MCLKKLMISVSDVWLFLTCDNYGGRFTRIILHLRFFLLMWSWPYVRQLTSRQETYGSTHLDKQNKHHHVCSQSCGSICTDPKCFTVLTSDTATCFVCTTTVLWQWSSQSKEAAMYMGTDWPDSSVSQREVRGQLHSFRPGISPQWFNEQRWLWTSVPWWVACGLFYCCFPAHVWTA